MASKDSGNQGKSPKKVNLLDQHAIKNLLDECVTEVGAELGTRRTAGSLFFRVAGIILVDLDVI